DALVDELIDAWPFATLVSQRDGEPFATHLPLLRERRGDRMVLVGHVARANPHWRSLCSATSMAVFHGPHGYVSPRWYVSPNLVPTWNYGAIHCYGRARLVDDARDARAILAKLVDRYEGSGPDRWRMQLDPDFEAKLVAAIVAFEIDVERIEAKLKLSQNRVPADRDAMLAALDADADAGTRELAALTRRVLAK
ncbi:MAG: FMN-binding negative transcriptional regulator, partial [Burkholderiales bacterium]